MIYIFTGARPNFMKVAPICRAMDSHNLLYKVFHTGQHTDSNLSIDFIKQLGIKDVHYLDCYDDNHVKMIQNIIVRATALFKHDNNAIVLVVGDVSSSYAVALAARRLHRTLIHVESGLRSFDISMPEEHNRISIDHMSDLLFTTCDDASGNLAEEGITKNVYMVGNVMIDTLRKMMPKIESQPVPSDPYIVVTFHRPENVDNFSTASKIISQLITLPNDRKVIFFMHPRAKKSLSSMMLLSRLEGCKNISIRNPVDYVEFMAHVKSADMVITDSGGIQEETTYLGIPCITVRKNTERPITILSGSNELIAPDEISNSVLNINRNDYTVPQMWDGYTAHRIVKTIEGYILKRSM